jgi:predicted dehydrogenase
MPIKIGVVGCGFGCAVQVPAFRRDPRVEVVAIAGRRLASAQRAAGEMAIPLAFGGWDALVSCPDVEAVAIATLPSVQKEAAVAALRLGKPVFAEKPLAATLPDARAMVEASDRAGVPAMVDFNLPELDAFRTAYQLVTAGKVGRLRHVNVVWNVESRVNANRFEHWKASRDEGGGTLFNFVSHSLHYLEWFCGPITRLIAHLGRMPGDTRGGDSTAILGLDFTSGAVGAISMSASAYRGLGHRIEFYGDDGSLVLENPTEEYMRGFALRYAVRPGPLELVHRAEESSGTDDSRITPTASIDRRFVDWILNGSPARPDFHDALRVQTLLDAAIRSDREGLRINVPAS